MNTRLQAVAIGLGLATLCATAAPVEAVTKSPPTSFGEPREAEALVYFIREKRFQGSGRTMFLYADEQFLGVLDNDAYTYAYLAPGAHLLWLNWARITEEVELEAGRTYYFTAWDEFLPLDEETGRAYLEAAGAYTTPEPKEEETAQDHIRGRYGEAERRAAKPDREHVGSQRQREEHVAEWPRVDLAPYSVLVVEDFTMADPKAAERTDELQVETAPRRLAELVANQVSEGVFDEVVRGALAEARPGAVVLRVELTQYKPGSATARFMIAGAGAARLDFTVHLVDGATGQELTSFASERSFAWGGVYGASGGIDSIERNAAYELGLYLKRCKGVETVETAGGGRS